MKRVILTGATGAIGTALISECIRQGTEVLALCRDGSPRNNRIPRHPLVTMRFCSLEQLAQVENDTGKTWDVFYHFAWEGTVGPARNDMYLQNRNVRYTLDAVAAAKRFGCHTFIGAGSQAEYGRVEGVLRPDTPAFPEMGYGMAKLCAGQMSRAYAHTLGLRHIWPRIVSVYGPNDGPQSMVMSTIRTLRQGEVPRLTKGEQMWDYLYSEDAARAFYALGKHGGDGKVYVLGSGQARPLADAVREIREETAPGGEIALGALPYGENQVMYLCADITELVQDTGWSPQWTFRQGIREILKQEFQDSPEQTGARESGSGLK